MVELRFYKQIVKSLKKIGIVRRKSLTLSCSSSYLILQLRRISLDFT
ncbi:DUF3678 domain-containing protein (plasmid) [Pseudoalteromonas lipolytica]|uniref:DUF3678 domain-containing protein n=1 Tax=Pseudoalteromonas lipolytica TaxID=570156 RepID=A0AAD0WEM7_9GAMM|nr:DUF3678 domain-containing protein [Pseudoalteromonas donghaensis]